MVSYISILLSVTFYVHRYTLSKSNHCIVSQVEKRFIEAHFLIKRQVSRNTYKHYLTTYRMTKNQPKEKLKWIIRPATMHDRDSCAALIKTSYSTLLINDYSAECLEKCLPLITTPREQLLTCNTWYVVEHPSTRQIVGCGGWTLQKPKPDTVESNDVNERTMAENSGRQQSPSCIDPKAPIPHIRHFATHPDYSRMGIASCIWNTIQMDIAKRYESEGKPFPILEVFSTLSAEAFYASCGFVRIDRVDVPIGHDAVFPAILMRRNPTKN
jgi:GNAT superfamily N-acetyltransferase